LANTSAWIIELAADVQERNFLKKPGDQSLSAMRKLPMA
jgi:hypothetical protein